MSYTLSSIIDLTNAPTPPRWFEFLLEPGRLQAHLELTNGCDPSPIQLITLFFRNIPNLETTSTIPPPINPILSPTISTSSTSTQSTANDKQHSPSGSSCDPDEKPKPVTTNGSLSPNTVDQSENSGAPNGTTESNSRSSGSSNHTGNNNELVERMYNDLNDPYDIVIPPNSYEAQYRLKKTYALHTLAIQVASFLKWDLDVLCNGLPIPVQCKLIQALWSACDTDACPHEVKRFASILHCHWFLRSAVTYKLSTVQPQSNSTTIIYLSQLQQQQQTADSLALLNMGEFFKMTSEQSKNCSEVLKSFIWDLTHNKDSSAKKLKGANHPFRKIKLSRPLMGCFDSRGEQFNDWSKCEPIESYEFIEAACYDLGRFYFFEEMYAMCKEALELIKNSTERFPFLAEYLNSSTDILNNSNIDGNVDESNEEDDGKSSPAIDLNYCDKLTRENNQKRKQTEKYLFDCMSQYQANKSQRDAVEVESVEIAATATAALSAATTTTTTSKTSMRKKRKAARAAASKLGEDTDLRIKLLEGQQQQQRPSNNDNVSWYLQVSATQQQQQLLEMGKGDAFMSRGNFKQAMGCFVGALVLITDYFRVFSKSYAEEEPLITRMIQCSISLSCFTQAVALCQMTRNLNYTIAFKQLNERVCNDCCDDIYECIWNVTLLEYIINLHARRGEVDRRTKVIQLIGQLELNENNPEEILREAEHVRRGKFFRIMSNKYL